MSAKHVSEVNKIRECELLFCFTHMQSLVIIKLFLKEFFQVLPIRAFSRAGFELFNSEILNGSEVIELECRKVLNWND